MGNAQRKCDALHDPGMIYIVTLYLSKLAEGESSDIESGAKRDKALAKYLAAGFTRDAGDILSDRNYTFSDGAVVTARGKVGVGKVVLNVRWKRDPDARPVYAEDVAHQICTELDWHNRKGSWPRMTDQFFVILCKETKWNVVVDGVLRYEYDGKTEDYSAHELLYMSDEDVKRKNRRKRMREKRKKLPAPSRTRATISPGGS